MSERLKPNIKIGKYRLERGHITVTIIIIIFFVLILMTLQRSSIHDMLTETQQWYRQHSAELLANTNTTSLELLIENMNDLENITPPEKKKIIQSFNIILTQQLLEKNIRDVCIIVKKGNKLYAVDSGMQLFNFLTNLPITNISNSKHKMALELFNEKYLQIYKEEKIISTLKNGNQFDILVPFAPYGELLGVFYLESKPDFSSITSEFLSSYNQMAIIYISLVLLALLTMFYITSYTVEERDKAQQRLFEEHQEHMKAEIEHLKESTFTKRIYHTHHKAEKVMGFLKEDLHSINTGNIEEIKTKVLKYANFTARAIYDMKWYDPPIQTIRNQIFNTNINEIITFIVDNIFLRISSKMEGVEFELNLDKDLPTVHINEFVIWEIIEPLIQNSIDHATNGNLIISVSTKFDKVNSKSFIIIHDNGAGLLPALLETDSNGIQNVFNENVTTKDVEEKRAGYGCYIAYEMAVKRCGWKLSAKNTEVGCSFIIEINN